MHFYTYTFSTAVLVALLLQTAWSYGQRSTFDIDNEGWGATGDPANSAALWIPSGGNPGGHIRVVDAATGDIWYFSAPPRFRGNKCSAYGRTLRWDQYINDTTQAHSPVGGRPDVVLAGAGLTLVYDLPYNPGINWTPFEVPLREDAGWRMNNLNGSPPSEAEFRAVLANITSLRIRGEYRTGPDLGGLDNVEMGAAFALDLDADNSSGAAGDDFNADTLCSAPYTTPVVDSDVLLFAEKPLDSLVLRLLLVKDAGEEGLALTQVLPAGLLAVLHSPTWLTLVNVGGVDAAALAQALRLVRYGHTSPAPTDGERLVALQAHGECGALGVRYAYLYLRRRGSAGLPGNAVTCLGGPAVPLFNALGGSPTPGGQWLPALPGGQFVAGVHTPGVYRYVAPAPANCPADTAAVLVRVEAPFHLGADTTLCRGDALRLTTPAYLTQWRWSNGSRDAFLDISTPGLYALEGSTAHCTFSDTITVAFLECEGCSFYAPNAFSPNNDGYNDEWQVFLSCLWLRFRMAIFDRWGNLVFQADTSESAWSGQWRGSPAPPGVYTWWVEWESETPQGLTRERRSGDVLLVR